MLSYKESLKILKESDALLEGHFILSSGLHTASYIQCAKLLSFPNKAQVVCNSLADKIKENTKDIDLILSPALGGTIIGYEIGKILNIETIFAERVEGKFQLRRGFEIKKNSKVLIVEDVITTGKSSLECGDLIKENNAVLVGFACIIDRSNSDNLMIKSKITSQIKISIPVFKENELPENLKKIKVTKPGSRYLKK